MTSRTTRAKLPQSEASDNKMYTKIGYRSGGGRWCLTADFDFHMDKVYQASFCFGSDSVKSH